MWTLTFSEDKGNVSRREQPHAYKYIEYARRRMREDKESSRLCTDTAEIRSISEAMLGGNGRFLLEHFQFRS